MFFKKREDPTVAGSVYRALDKEIQRLEARINLQQATIETLQKDNARLVSYGGHDIWTRVTDELSLHDAVVLLLSYLNVFWEKIPEKPATYKLTPFVTTKVKKNARPT